jgi:Family of unknown function (DUF6496)
VVFGTLHDERRTASAPGRRHPILGEGSSYSTLETLWVTLVNDSGSANETEWIGCVQAKLGRGKEISRAKKRKRKYSRNAGKDVKNEMHRYKRGKAKSGRRQGRRVKSRWHKSRLSRRFRTIQVCLKG